MDNNKVLLITGASSDIGKNLVKSVADQYRTILAHYNHSKEEISYLQELYGEKIVAVHADFSSEESTKKLIIDIRKKGMVPDHIVHLSAVKAFNQKFHKTNWCQFQEGIDTSLRSIVILLKEFIPDMSRKKAGKVIFMLSAYTQNNPPKYQTTYVSVKYALLGLMKSLAVEYAEKGITFNAVSPEMIETKFLSEVPELIKEQYGANGPLKRNLFVREVVPTIEFLLSEKAERITGQNIAITGGR